MWLFITARLRQWVLFAVIVPIATTLIHLIRVRLEARDPDSQVVRAMKTIERFGSRRSQQHEEEKPSKV